MKVISVKLPESYIEKMEKLIKEGRFTNKSELIRFALLDLFRKEEGKNEGKIKLYLGP